MAAWAAVASQAALADAASPCHEADHARRPRVDLKMLMRADGSWHSPWVGATSSGVWRCRLSAILRLAALHYLARIIGCPLQRWRYQRENIVGAEARVVEGWHGHQHSQAIQNSGRVCWCSRHRLCSSAETICKDTWVPDFSRRAFAMLLFLKDQAGRPA